MKKWSSLSMNTWEVFAGETEKSVLLKLPNTDYFFYYPKSLIEIKNSAIVIENVKYIITLFFKPGNKIRLLKETTKQYGSKIFKKYIEIGKEVEIEKIKEELKNYYNYL